LPDIVFDSISWNPSPIGDWTSNPTTAGGVEITYAITHAKLSKAAPVALYWADGPGVGNRLSNPAITTNADGAPILTKTNEGEYSLFVSAASLGQPPKSTTGLQVVLNADVPGDPHRPVPETNRKNDTGLLDASPAAILDDSLHYTISGMRIYVNFMPAEGDNAPSAPAAGALTLAQAASILKVDHFNWIQTLTAPSYVTFFSPAMGLMSPLDSTITDRLYSGSSPAPLLLEFSTVGTSGALGRGHAFSFPNRQGSSPFYWPDPPTPYQYPAGSSSPAELQYRDTPTATFHHPDFLMPGGSYVFQTALSGVSASGGAIQLPLQEEIKWTIRRPPAVPPSALGPFVLP
jgi:hypothetical protein